MSEIDVRLNWKEEPVERTGEDRFVPAAAAAGSEPGTLVSLAEPPEESSADLEEFEFSEHRAQALERALGRLAGVARPPILRYLSELIGQADSADFPGRLDAAEAWLSCRLHDWQEVRSVQPDDDSPEAEERAQLFNRSLSAGADALMLSLEVVSLLRSGDFALVERLLEQVETSMTEARDTLLAVGE